MVFSGNFKWGVRAGIVYDEFDHCTFQMTATLSKSCSTIISRFGEQREQRILAHKPEQAIVGCIAIFHKYCGYINMEVL